MARHAGVLEDGEASEQGVDEVRLELWTLPLLDSLAPSG